MKQLFLMMMAALVLWSSCANNESGETARQTPQAASGAVKFHQQYQKALSAYLALKDALVSSDQGEAGQAAAALKNALAQLESALSEGGLPEGWRERLSQLQAGCEQVAAAADLESQRSAFLVLSNAMIESARAVGPLDKAFYVQHCPMAFDNSGGDWLSDSQEIYNPYFGDKMLHCGMVKEALARK